MPACAVLDTPATLSPGPYALSLAITAVLSRPTSQQT